MRDIDHSDLLETETEAVEAFQATQTASYSDVVGSLAPGHSAKSAPKVSEVAARSDQYLAACRFAVALPVDSLHVD